MGEKMKPCPFCGRVDSDDNPMQESALNVIMFKSPAGGMAFRVGCVCGASSESSREESDAIAAWNRRSEGPTNTAGETRDGCGAIECSYRCDGDFSFSDCPNAIHARARRASDKAGEEAPVAWSDVPEKDKVLLDVLEATTTLCEWFGQREMGLPTSNSEVRMFERVSNVSARIEAVLDAAPSQEAIPCYECRSTERIGTACAPCNPELRSQEAVVSEGKKLTAGQEWALTTLDAYTSPDPAHDTRKALTIIQAALAQGASEGEWKPVDDGTPKDRNVIVISDRFPEPHEARNYTHDGWIAYGANGGVKDNPTLWRDFPTPPPSSAGEA